MTSAFKDAPQTEIESDTDEWVRVSEETDGPRIARMRLQIHTGKASSAFSDIERLARVAERQGRVHRLIRLHILAALAKAVEYAQAGGYIRMFFDEGPMIALLLSELTLSPAVSLSPELAPSSPF